MQKHHLLSRRGALRAALSASVALGTGALAHAATPFTSASSWHGMIDSDAPDSAQLNITSSNGIQSGGNMSFKGAQLAVTITWNGNGDIQIKDGNGKLSITGTASQQWVTTSFSGTYTYLAPGAPIATQGNLSLLSLATQGLVSPDPTDANIPSISIVPPDWRGLFQAQSGASGALTQQITGGHNARAPFSLVTGQVAFNNTLFNYVLTFAPKPSDDGSFAFTLVGNNSRVGSVTPFTVLNGRFFPGSSRTLAVMKGAFTLIGVKGDPFDLGEFSLTEAR